MSADPRLGKSRHAVMAGERRAQDQKRHRRPRPLAQTHVQRDDGLLLHHRDQPAMAGLGAFMAQKAMFQSIGIIDQQDAGRNIPGLELEFPEPVETSGGNAGQVETGDPGPPNRLGGALELFEMQVVVGRMNLVVVGKPGSASP